ncbi:hypothetical protein WMF27_41075 [Sorangium sp. So ce281]|uniref:hypothetical protein n=1 Tax=unclassified Sorangium TaxID=2621164 RepID=UPI003F5E43D4
MLLIGLSVTRAEKRRDHPGHRQRERRNDREENPAAPARAEAMRQALFVAGIAMNVLHIIRIETAPGGAVHLITEAGERIIVRRREDDAYSTARVVRTIEEEVADRHLLTVEALPRRGAEPALF